MKKFLTLVLGSTALMGASMIGAAQAEPDYPYAATGFFGGGGSWLSSGNQFNEDDDDDDSDVAHLEGGGDIVIPLHGYWNVQLGGAFHTDHLHFRFGGSNSRTQFQGSAIGFWRDPASGVLGLEFGFFSPFGNERNGVQNSIKIGGVAEYFFSDMLTFGAFGGALIPMDENPFSNQKGGGKSFDTGFYAGGDLTYYASDTLALVGYARFTELNDDFDRGDSSSSQRSFNVGGKVRYLTAMPGVELYASGSYLNCEVEQSFRGRGSRTFGTDGAQFMGGVEIHLGGHTDSLVAIDRSNSIDTRAWACPEAEVRLSDRRLKTDITNLGETANGIKLYSWKYLSDPVNTWVGAMAQDLETSHPEALVSGTDGYYRVNYSALGVQMMTLDQWNSRKL